MRRRIFYPQVAYFKHCSTKDTSVAETETPKPKKASLLDLSGHPLNKWRKPSDSIISAEYSRPHRFLDACRDLVKDSTLPIGCVASYFCLPFVGFAGFMHWISACLALAAINRATVVHGFSNRTKKDLTNKNVLVVGTSNLGISTAVQLAEMNANVFIAGHPERRIPTSEAVAAIAGKDSKLQYLDVDIADHLSIRTLASQVRTNLSSLDVLVHCNLTTHPDLEFVKRSAGGKGNAYEELTLATNFLGPFHLTERLLPLLEASEGRVIAATSRTHQVIVEQAIARQLLEIKPDDETYQGYRYFGLSCLGTMSHVKEIAAKHPRVGAACVNVGTVAHGEVTSTPQSVGFMSKILAKTGWEASQSIVNAAVRSDFRSGGYYSDLVLRPHGRSRVANDAKLRDEIIAWATQHTVKKYT